MKTEDKIVWIYKCGSDWKYCKDGFCGRYNQLKEDHEHPAVGISKEWFEVTGREWKPDTIREQFRKLTVTKSDGCDVSANKEQELKQKKKIKQDVMWKKVDSKLNEILEYIANNYESPTKSSNGTTASIISTLDLIKTYFE